MTKKDTKFKHFQQNNWIIEFGGGPLEVIWLSILLRACPTSTLNPSLKLEWSKPSPVKFWKSPGMENSQRLWPAYSIVLPQPVGQIAFLQCNCIFGPVTLLLCTVEKSLTLSSPQHLPPGCWESGEISCQPFFPHNKQSQHLHHVPQSHCYGLWLDSPLC